MRAGTKDAFCKSLGLNDVLEISWFSGTGTVLLGDERWARLDLQTNGTVGHFDRVLLTVFSKKYGRLDAKDFVFDDYFPKTMADRLDGREEYDGGFHAWSGRGDELGWYIAKPSPASLRKLADSLAGYLAHWRE